MKPRILIPSLAVALFLVGCATMFTSVVTVTQVVDTTMKAWADLSVKGLTTPAVDAKVVMAHDRYRDACSVAQLALIEYKKTGDNTKYVQAMTVTKVAASAILDLVVPLLTAKDGADLKAKLAKAEAL